MALHTDGMNAASTLVIRPDVAASWMPWVHGAPAVIRMNTSGSSPDNDVISLVTVGAAGSCCCTTKSPITSLPSANCSKPPS